MVELKPSQISVLFGMGRLGVELASMELSAVLFVDRAVKVGWRPPTYVKWYAEYDLVILQQRWALGNDISFINIDYRYNIMTYFLHIPRIGLSLNAYTDLIECSPKDILLGYNHK